MDTLSPVVKRQGYEADHSHQLSAEFTPDWIFISISLNPVAWYSNKFSCRLNFYIARLTWACVKRTRRFRRCASGNCMGLVSPVTLHVDRPDMLPMFMFMPAVADEPMRRETAKSRIGVHELKRTRQAKCYTSSWTQAQEGFVEWCLVLDYYRNRGTRHSISFWQIFVNGKCQKWMFVVPFEAYIFNVLIFYAA
jgi:hypothetical protein